MSSRVQQSYHLRDGVVPEPGGVGQLSARSQQAGQFVVRVVGVFKLRIQSQRVVLSPRSLSLVISLEDTMAAVLSAIFLFCQQN